MKAIGMSPAVLRWSLWLGLWGVAAWFVLSLHDRPIAQSHSICGPWGCGPTIAALLSAHGFWLLVAIPSACWAARGLTAERAVKVGGVCLGLGVGGIIAVVVGDLLSWPGYARPAGRAFLAQRVLFSLATTVEVPLFPISLVGLILISAGRRRRPHRFASEFPTGAETCADDRCHPSGVIELVHRSSRIEVGRPLPEFTLVTPDGQSLALPAAVKGQPTIIYFMRRADCSICRGHVRALGKLVEEHHLPGAQVVIVQPGGLLALMALSDSLPPSCTITSGRDQAYAAVGLADRPFRRSRGSGTILVDRSGIVRHVRLASLPFGSFSRAELVEAYQLRAEALHPVVG